MSKGGGWHAEELVLYSSPKCLHTILIARVSNRGYFLPIEACEKCLRLAAKKRVRIRQMRI